MGSCVGQIMSKSLMTTFLGLWRISNWGKLGHWASYFCRKSIQNTGPRLLRSGFRWKMSSVCHGHHQVRIWTLLSMFGTNWMLLFMLGTHCHTTRRRCGSLFRRNGPISQWKHWETFMKACPVVLLHYWRLRVAIPSTDFNFRDRFLFHLIQVSLFHH